MGPLDVISLAQAKDFLVIDYPDRDAEIERHIKSAIAYIEKYTNVMMYNREKSYTMYGCSTEVYDFPITLDDTTIKTHQNVLSLTVYGKSGTAFSANVGYSDVNNIPPDLIEAAYKLIVYLTENKDIYTAGLPMDIQLLINKHRRSATF